MDESDRRLTSQLFQQWQQSCGIALPPIGIFKRAAIMGLWPNCILVAVEYEPKLAYKCEHMGSTISKAYGQDLTGAYLPPTATQFPGTVAFEKLGEVVKVKKPVEDDGEFLDREGKTVKYRACFLPYGEDPKMLTHILVGISFKQF